MRSANCAATLRSCITTRHASSRLLHLGREQLVEIELVAHVEERAGLVEQHHLRLLRERARDGDAFLLAAAQRMRAAERRARRDRSARAPRRRSSRPARDGRIHAPWCGARPIVTTSRTVKPIATLLLLLDDRQTARDVGPRRASRRPRRAAAPAPARSRQQPRRDADEGGLSGAVRAEHADELAGAERQVDMLELALRSRVTGAGDPP